MVYDLSEFPECPFCGSTPTLHTDGSTFVELVCMCEGSPCTIDLPARWRIHLYLARDRVEEITTDGEYAIGR